MSGVENVHISTNRWHTVKGVVLRAEDEGGRVLVRAVRVVMVGEAGKILFERKFNIIS